VDLDSHGHSCQLFDGRDTSASAVSGFFREGLVRGDTLLGVMRPETWTATARRLQSHGVDAEELIASGQLKILDAAATLVTFLNGGHVDEQLFDDGVGALVRSLVAEGRQLRVYGEMVDILAAEGDFRSALRLEALWNDLRSNQRFILFCGYSAVNFGSPTAADVLRQTCRAHTHVRTNPRDVLATFLLQASSSGTRP
jgi:MEDS: MEthanogen/methylotroph, DcmR Sensory domain